MGEKCEKEIEGVACQKLQRMDRLGDLMDRLRDPIPRVTVKLFASRPASDALSQRCPKQIFQVRKKANFVARITAARVQYRHCKFSD